MKRYYLKLTALTPIHIGTGEVYEPTNFVVDNGYLYEFDEVLFYKALDEISKKNFDNKLNNLFSIISFYKKNKDKAKKIYNHKVKVSKEIEKRYITQFNKDGSVNKNQLNIEKTYKDPNTNLPVIPGSSLKGVFDTFLHIYSKPEVASNETRQKLNISDALTIKSKLEIGIAKRVHKNPDKKAKSSIPTNIEIINEDSKFVCSVYTEFDMTEIVNKIENFYTNQKRYSSYFKTDSNSFVIRVGKFCGKPYMVYETHNIINSYGKDVATHTLYHDKEFGWLKVELIEKDEYDECIKKHQSIKEKETQKAKLQKQKEEAKRKEEEEKLKKQEQEQEKLSKMSPLDKIIYELQKNNPNKNETIDIIIFNAIKQGKLDEFKYEALKRLKDEMINLKKWVETSKKPQKDKKYKRTQEVIKMLEEFEK